MVIRGAVLRSERGAYQAALDQGSEHAGIAEVDFSAPCGDLLHVFELAKQEGGQHVGWHIGRADIHPGVFVHLPPHELAPVSALLTQDLSALLQSRVVDRQRSAFAAREVLGFMKAVAAHLADGAEPLALVFGTDTVAPSLDNYE